MKKFELSYLNIEGKIVTFKIEQNCCDWYLSLCMAEDFKTGNIEIDNVLDRFKQVKALKAGTIAMKDLSEGQIMSITQDTQKLSDLFECLENDKLFNNEKGLIEFLENNEKCKDFNIAFITAFLYEWTKEENLKIPNLETFLNSCEFEEGKLLTISNDGIEFLVGTEEDAETLARETLKENAWDRITSPKI